MSNFNIPTPAKVKGMQDKERAREARLEQTRRGHLVLKAVEELVATGVAIISGADDEICDAFNENGYTTEWSEGKITGSKTIKLADVIDNLSDIVKHDPQFASVFAHEKELLLEVLRDGNELLWKEAKGLVEDAKVQLSQLESGEA